MVTWPKFKWWLQLGFWPAMPCSEAEARVAKSSYFLACRAPGASMNLSEIMLVLRKYGT